ncbi:MAG: arginyltransferase [Pseudomonadota bacterium]
MRKEDIRRRLGLEAGEYYLTAPSPCPYLPNRVERKVFAYLGGRSAPTLNSLLSQRGFRRSQNIIYMPACETCMSCIPVRIVVDAFDMTKSRRRIVNKNRDLIRQLRAPRARSEQFSLLRAYLDARHADGGMADMTVLDYASMVEETAVDTVLVEYAARDASGPEELAACALTDRLSDGLSMVYSFFDPALDARSLGRFMILDHVALAAELGLPYVYLGYWVKGSAKMQYKVDFQPLEYLTRDGWTRTPG